MSERGVLYVVATPIGNLSDLSARAADTLASVDRVAAEDTRRTRALLTHLGIAKKPVEALHAHSDDGTVARLVARLESGESVAVVSDAGTPAVSDPGDALTRAAIAAGIRVVPVPGPSAVLAALVGSGIGGESGFRFVGFIARDGTRRREALSEIARTRDPVVLFESPNRVRDTLVEIAEATPGRPCVVARELTKIHEEFVRGTVGSLAADAREWRGEIVVVLGAHDPAAREEAVTEEAVDHRIDAELAQGLHAKTIAEKLALWSGRPKRELYERIVSRKDRTRGSR
ncbi:MAG: 16S rRNA (cytidine(1402)-2'-O)-methyltransferase [Polyangiaceae bacterium]